MWKQRHDEIIFNSATLGLLRTEGNAAGEISAGGSRRAQNVAGPQAETKQCHEETQVKYVNMSIMTLDNLDKSRQIAKSTCNALCYAPLYLTGAPKH